MTSPRFTITEYIPPAQPECAICRGPTQGKKEINIDICDACHPQLVADFEREKAKEKWRT